MSSESQRKKIVELRKELESIYKRNSIGERAMLANEVEKLRAQVAKLRGVLNEFLSVDGILDHITITPFSSAVLNQARTALEETKP